MKPGLILLLLAIALAATACANSNFEVVGQEVFSTPDGFVLDCTVRNISDKPRSVSVSGALLTQKKATAAVRYISGDLEPGEAKTFVLKFDEMPFKGFLCRAQELYNRFF